MSRSSSTFEMGRAARAKEVIVGVHLLYESVCWCPPRRSGNPVRYDAKTGSERSVDRQLRSIVQQERSSIDDWGISRYQRRQAFP